jgi:hypothetical protein
MADETPPPPGVAGQPERRRPRPTIDLKATEIASAPMGPPRSPPTEPPPDEPNHDAAPEAQSPSGALHGWLGAVSWPLVGAGLAGAVLTLGLVWIVLLATDRSADVSAAQERIAQLERTVASATSANSASNGDLAGRLQKLEAQASSPRAPVTDPVVISRIAAVETQLKSLGEAADTLGRRSESAAAANAAALRELNEKLARSGAAEAQTSEASSEAANANTAQIAALASRVDAVEGSAKKLEDDEKKFAESTDAKLAEALAQRSAEAADERAVRTGIIAAALTAAVERGAPFAPELAAAQAQAANPGALAPLAPYAATGLGDVGALARELTSLVPALRQAAAPAAPEGSFLEKLSANAQRLVRITPIDQVPGEDTPAVIARLEGDAARGDLAGALAELGKLAPAVRAPAQPWLAKAQAREAALAASRAFASDALAALVH